MRSHEQSLQRLHVSWESEPASKFEYPRAWSRRKATNVTDKLIGVDLAVQLMSQRIDRGRVAGYGFLQQRPHCSA